MASQNILCHAADSQSVVVKRSRISSDSRERVCRVLCHAADSQSVDVKRPCVFFGIALARVSCVVSPPRFFGFARASVQCVEMASTATQLKQDLAEFRSEFSKKLDSVLEQVSRIEVEFGEVKNDIETDLGLNRFNVRSARA